MAFVFMTADNTSGYEEKSLSNEVKLLVPKKEIVLSKDFTKEEKELLGFFG